MYTTMVNIGGGVRPRDRIVDGKDITTQLFNLKATEKRVLFFYCNDILFAVRYGDYKLHFNSMPVKTKPEYGENCGAEGFPTTNYFVCLFCPSDCVREHEPPLIYNVEADPSEIYELDPTKYEKILREVNVAIIKHKMTLKIGNALYSSYDKMSKPCCDESKESCSCNYP